MEHYKNSQHTPYLQHMPSRVVCLPSLEECLEVQALLELPLLPATSVLLATCVFPATKQR